MLYPTSRLCDSVTFLGVTRRLPVGPCLTWGEHCSGCSESVARAMESKDPHHVAGGVTT